MFIKSEIAVSHLTIFFGILLSTPTFARYCDDSNPTYNGCDSGGRLCKNGRVIGTCTPKPRSFAEWTDNSVAKAENQGANESLAQQISDHRFESDDGFYALEFGELARGLSRTSIYLKTLSSSTVRKNISVTSENLWKNQSPQTNCSLRYSYRSEPSAESVYLFSNYLSHHDASYLPSQNCHSFYSYALKERTLAAEVTANLELWQNHEDGDIWDVEQCFVSVKFQTEDIGSVVLMGPAADDACTSKTFKTQQNLEQKI